MSALDLAVIFGSPAPRSPFRRCEWCGWPCYGRACSSHRDLTQLLHTETQSPSRTDQEVARGTGFDNTGG